jgi:2-iminobutanoate/2-iminopropanoate deaminase
MTDRKRITTPPERPAPAALGPYSQAVSAGGFIHCSGQIAIDPSTGNLVAGDVSAQTEQVLTNLGAVLGAASSSLARAVKCTVYLKSMSDFAAMNAVYARHFPADAPPARSTVAVADLPRGALVEIDCTALA